MQTDSGRVAIGPTSSITLYVDGYFVNQWDAACIVALEDKQAMTFGGVTVNVKLDRMDRLAGGAAAILDYKTGACKTADWMGAGTEIIVDVGVAGPQRLLAKLDRITKADAVVVVAGMEAALASVVGGHVACPVIAVPTSVGYGASFGGLAALLSMLNSCALGVSVVNIDNGFGAGYQAHLINQGCKVARKRGAA